MDCFSALSLYAPKAHLIVTGELDAFAAVGLRDRLDEAVDRGCVHFTVDASAVTFLDAGGLGSLIRLRNAVAPYGGTVAVTDASLRFRQMVEIVGLAAVFDLDLLPERPDPTGPHVVALRGQRGARTSVGPAAGGHSSSVVASHSRAAASAS